MTETNERKRTPARGTGDGGAGAAGAAGGGDVGGSHVEVPWREWVAPPPPRRVRRWRGPPARSGRRTGTAPTASQLGLLVGAAVSLPWREMLRELSTRRDGGVRSELGIDLGARGHEVRKLFFAGGYHRTAVRAGLDPEEALQEVFRGILIRNQGRCPWDATKSSFGHYVHIVIRCVLSNYVRKERRRAGREFLAGPSETGERERTVDGVTEAEREGSEGFARWQLVAAVFPGAADSEVAAAVALVEGLGRGKPRREVAAELGRSLSWADDTVRRLRTGYAQV